MITKVSQSLLATTREAPADAEALSHKLLVRGGFVRPLAAGLWSFLPSGLRVLHRVEGIIREEMRAIGAQEVLLPLINPRELWEQTGRTGLDVQYAFRDRSDRDMVLALTHEEAMTFHAARELRSWRDLPQIWWHLQLKGRDEARARGGLLRTREFTMKDSYSFDRDAEGLAESYARHERAYSRIFDRCGLDWFVVESDTGDMGGSLAHEYMAPCPAGEDTVARCASCGYGANVEVATSTPALTGGGERLDAPREIETPTQRTIEEVADHLGVPHHHLAKAMPVVTADGRFVLCVVRGDHQLNEVKASKALGGGGRVRPAHEDEIAEHLGASPGFLGPVGVAERGVEVVVDAAIEHGAWVVGANRDGWHLAGVEAGRDFEARVADIRGAAPGDACAACGGALAFETVIEIGNIFQLGTRYSEPLGATYLGDDGREHLMVMGSYGIGPARIMAAAAEQRGDERGIAWPATIAPWDVHVVSIGDVAAVADPLLDELSRAGLEVLHDERGKHASPGVKFADAELVGCPVRITVGKRAAQSGTLDVQLRASADDAVAVPIADVASTVDSALEQLRKALPGGKQPVELGRR